MRAAGVVVITVAVAAGMGLTDSARQADEAPAVDVERAWTAASCDQNDAAFDVEPNTAEAWRQAQEWCTRSGAAIDNLPWPSGFKPVPVPAP